jgi:hypothetical protein
MQVLVLSRDVVQQSEKRMASRADYYKGYRVTAAARKRREAERDGVQLAVKLLRLTVGTATVTGYEAATMIERTLLLAPVTSFVVRVTPGPPCTTSSS